MSNVKMRQIPFDERYIYLALDQDIFPDSIVIKLRLIYGLIDKQFENDFAGEYGNAYRAILRKARELAGNRKYIISKRQVASLIKIYEKNDISYIRIPYACDYIFRAILALFEEYKNDVTMDISKEIQVLYGNIRRDIFYKTQSEQYKYKYTHNLLSEREELKDIRRALLNDLCSDECAIGKRF